MNSPFTYIYYSVTVTMPDRCSFMRDTMSRSVTMSTGIPMQNAAAVRAGYATSDSLLKQAEALRAQAVELAAVITGAANQAGSASMPGKNTAALVKRLIRTRAQRAKFFPRGLFSEPAWEMLLELYAAEFAQRRVSVSQLCVTARLPATTGLRWLSTLEASRLVIRIADPLDARRSFVSLTSEGLRSMESFIDSIKDALLDA
jgi:DNA-binding MarR family transcriptional regulator